MSQTTLPFRRTPRPDSEVDGRWKAVGRDWFSELNDAVREFRRLGTPEARAAFADNWIGIWASDFDRAWPMVYELLRLVEEQRLYLDPRRVGPGAPGGHHGERTYTSFADYFTDRVKQPFKRWAELEHTYRYAQTYAPELFKTAFSEASLKAHGQPKDAPRDEKGRYLSGSSKGDNVTLRGNSVVYILARLDRDGHRELAAAVREGFLSASAAAMQAGYRKPPPAITELRRAWKRATPEERAAFLAEIEP